jgi:hypothetical protein
MPPFALDFRRIALWRQHPPPGPSVRPPPQGGRRYPRWLPGAIILLSLSQADATIIEQPTGEPGLTMSPQLMPQPAFKTRLLQVGPGRRLKLPSKAAALARTGDVVEIDAETYVGDVAVWTADNLTIRGVGGRPKLLAAGESAENKATWVIKGRNAVVEGIEFAEAVSTNGNGAGIRAEGINLTVRDCYFHDNQEGILSALNTTTSRIVIEIPNSTATAAMAAIPTKSTSATSPSSSSAATTFTMAGSGI